MTIGYDLGFTGPRTGTSGSQRRSLDQLFLALYQHGYRRFHCGDCVGADVDAWNYATQYFQITIHPPINPRFRAFLTGYVYREPYDYHVRNKNIVHESHVLVATSPEERERVRSGTWSTVRYARSLSLPVYLIWPNGTMELQK